MLMFSYVDVIGCKLLTIVIIKNTLFVLLHFNYQSYKNQFYNVNIY
jgi:hypothetical protein